MIKKDKKEHAEDFETSEEELDPNENEQGEDNIDSLKEAVTEEKNKYLRLYAEFENYKKISARNKEELFKYANEGLMTDMLTVIDHLELALQHSSDENADPASLAEGVEITLKEMKNVLEKHGLVNIDASGKPFDPSIHHAISQVETEEFKENTIVQEFRKGYMLKERVLRAAMVAVSKSPTESVDTKTDNNKNHEVATDE